MKALPVDPETFPGDFEIRLKPDAEKILADAVPGVRRGRGTQPSKAQLLRMPRSATPTNLFVHRLLPHNTSLARIAILHGHRRGIPWYEALNELCEIVPVPAKPAASAA